MIFDFLLKFSNSLLKASRLFFSSVSASSMSSLQTASERCRAFLGESGGGTYSCFVANSTMKSSYMLMYCQCFNAKWSGVFLDRSCARMCVSENTRGYNICTSSLVAASCCRRCSGRIPAGRRQGQGRHPRCQTRPPTRWAPTHRRTLPHCPRPLLKRKNAAALFC